MEWKGSVGGNVVRLTAEFIPSLNMRFDEALDPAAITPNNFRLERALDNSSVAGTLKHYLVGKQSVPCFFPAQPLLANENSEVNMNTKVKLGALASGAGDDKH